MKIVPFLEQVKVNFKAKNSKGAEINFFSVQIQRYNILLNEIRTSLLDLEKGIQGLVVMTLDLEIVFNCLHDGLVPPAWQKVGF